MRLLNISLTDMTLVQMSFSAAIMILVIIVVRGFTINKLPKKVFVFLWEVVLLRLLIPFSIPSVFSAYTFVQRNESIREVINEVPAVAVITQVGTVPTNVGMPTSDPAGVHSSVSVISTWMIFWGIGFILCAAFFAVSYVRCYIEFRASIPVRNEFTDRWLRCHRRKRIIQIRQSDKICTPLTYGILKPVILMPKKTDWENTQQLEYILLHEYTHICRFDLVTKLIAALALCIHWFNPFVWVMYILFNRDIELACDETVVRRFGENVKSVYARTLITLEEKKSGLTPLYNGFSRNAIEERITAVMKTKKMTIGILIISVLVVLAIIVPFATSAKEQEVKQITNENDAAEEKPQDMNRDPVEGIIGDETFTEDLELLLGVGTETAEDYYSMVTSASAEEVEQFAAEIKSDVLSKDWESLAQKLVYPFQMDGKVISSSMDFLNLDIDENLRQGFVDAVAAESCREMFYNYQGIMMGATGQIWFASVDTGSGQWELKVIALNGMIEEISLSEVMYRISGQGLEKAIPYEKGHIGIQKDAVIKLCASENEKFEAYGFISPEYGQMGILLNYIISGEGNWTYLERDWGYGKKTPEIKETGSNEIMFSYYREDGSWCELIFDTYETGTLEIRESGNF